MTKEELNELSFAEIENIIDEAIKEGHIKFLSQLAEEDDRTNNQVNKQHVVC